MEESKITFRVYDRKRVLEDEIIGQYELDLSSIYFMFQHEIYMGWLCLYDPLDKREGVQGFLKVNVQVVGPGDEPVVHDLADMKNAANEQNFFAEKTVNEGHLVNIDIYEGENLAPVMSPVGSKHYVRVKYSGVYCQTEFRETLAPLWNSNVLLGCTLPN